MTDDRTRPDLDDQTVEALGKLSEALETVDQARGFLYAFHQLTGKADRLLQESVDLFRGAGAAPLADDLERDLVGRNVIADRWTFQLVEDFDANEIARRASLGPPRPPARPRPAAAAENSRAMDPALASVTWSDLERISPVVWRRATRLARDFGYDY